MRAKRRGFTLVELMIVVTIIGILLAFILKAYTGSVRAAERAATISLIAKLESALTDRIDALTDQMNASPTWCHEAMATVYPGGTTRMPSPQRAAVIARYDFLRSELPDVFVLEMSDANYPINFGALPFSPTAAALTSTYLDYTLPLGAGWQNPNSSTPDVPPITGMKGASFAAAAAIYKQLGFSQKGLDGADNDNDNMIDEWDEGTMGLSAAQIADMTARLAKHTHKTARAEMLYAILVEGTGPLGSVMNKDDFNGQEVRDTDGDGLLEFVDAWGEPIQFYRWPIFYRSDLQKGYPDLAKITLDLQTAAKTGDGRKPGPYMDVYEQREQDPLDPNQTLLAPAWWGSYNGGYPYGGGSPTLTFGSIFHTLMEPLAIKSVTASSYTYWDRSTGTGSGVFTDAYQRRAYYSRFLVVSGGPDKIPGVAQLGVDYQKTDERSSFPLSDGSFDTTRDGSGTLVLPTVLNVITIENQAGKVDPNRISSHKVPDYGPGFRNDTNTQLEEYAADDITTQNLHAPGGVLPSNQ